MRLIDIHAHLTFKSFKNDLDQVLERARKNGVVAIIDSGIDPEDSLKALDLRRSYPSMIFVSIGLAPQMADELKFNKTIELLEKVRGSYVAVGEIGLDYYWVKDPKRRQACKRYFSTLLSFAINNDLPVVIHNREATKDVIGILNDYGAERVVFHAFMGNAEEALEIIKRGWYISIPTIIARSDRHQRLVKKVPLENLMLETDSPFLSPTPRSRNEPANVRVSAEIIAKIKQLSLERLCERLYENTVNFFSLNLPS
ncbi:MAG: TatD family hydrolase [Candidatus Njordarchaeales archaeon]